MQDVQGSIAKDTAAVCIATILLVALLAGAAMLWNPPPAQGPQARFQAQEPARSSAHGPQARLPVATVEAMAQTPIPPFVF